MFTAVFSQALRDATRLRRLLPWFLLAVLCTLLASIWGGVLAGAKPIDSYVSVTGIIVFRILALGSAVMTTSIISQEIEQKTIVYLLTRPVPRWQLLIGRFLASIVVVALMSMLAAVFTNFGAYKSLTANAAFTRDLLAITLGAMAYGALFLFISLLFNRALIVCVLFAFGWESSIPQLQEGMHRLSIMTHVQAISAHPDVPGGKVLDFAAGSSTAKLISTGSAATVLLGVFALFTVLSAIWFSKHEYVPREDAE